MSIELFTTGGQRKYLNAEELDNFLAISNQHERAVVRTFCLVMAHTGARISEILALTVDNIDLEEKVIIFRTLKQRTERHRAVPIPQSTLDALELVHSIRRGQRAKRRKNGGLLWSWSRMQGWKHIKPTIFVWNIVGFV